MSFHTYKLVQPLILPLRIQSASLSAIRYKLAYQLSAIFYQTTIDPAHESYEGPG